MYMRSGYAVRRRRGLGAAPDVVAKLAAAIARMENVNPAYNNPGGLIAAPGCTSRPGAIAICPDAETGQAGLERQVGLDIDRGMTLADLVNSWAPKCSAPICKGNDPTVYAANVSSWTGFDLNVPLNQLGGAVVGDSGGGAASDIPLDSGALVDAGTFDLGTAAVWGIGLLAAVLLLRG